MEKSLQIILLNLKQMMELGRLAITMLETLLIWDQKKNNFSPLLLDQKEWSNMGENIQSRLKATDV